VPAHQSNLIRVLSTNKVDIVIISATLNSIAEAGVELAVAVFGAHPKIPIVLLIDEPERDLVVRAFLSGARGVFNLQDPLSEFIDCVEHVRNGAIWAGKGVADQFLEAIRSIPAPNSLVGDGLSDLTVRELQVVQCAARGKTNQEIADELHLSKHTVKNYLFKAFEKLQVSSRVELLFYLAMRGYSLGNPRTTQKKNPGGTVNAWPARPTATSHE
jgi:DNA-binding NarL/FixJ family response regulator